MQGKYKSKGIKKVTKIKKYTSGTEGLDLTKYSQVGGMVGGLGALGIEGLTASKYDGKYTSQLKDENQALGRGIGAGVGQAANLLVPGLGTIASPLLSSAGGSIQRSFQEDKLKAIKQNAEYKENVAKANEGIGTDLTSFQAKQYSKGGTVKPYVAKDAKDYKFRKGAYNDSLNTYNKYSNTKQSYLNKGFDLRADTNGFKDSKGFVTFATNTNNQYADIKLDKEIKPIQEILAPKLKPSINTLKTKSTSLELPANTAPISGTIESIKPKSYKRVRVASTQPGYENMREYSHYVNKPQYSKGTKVIEIEGKGTPEIHTDKNFNLKNLGTTPHSKGGNKVVAEEGDIVFPTQNSTKKFNEVIEAVMTKDKYKLKKEQNKLPEDKTTKYAKGAKKLKSRFDGKTYNTNTTNQYGRFNKYEDAKKALAKGDGSATVFKTDPLGNHKGSVLGYVDPRNTDGSMSFYKHEMPVEDNTEAKVTTPTLSKAQIDGRAAEDSYKFPTKNGDVPVTPAENPNKSSNFENKYNPLELASTAYNLGTGLFGNAEKVNRKEYTPELEKYVDTSSNLRREVNTGYKGALSNARNLSAGNANNFRANAQAAANNKFDQINKVDSQEYGKQVDVNNRNVDRINKAKGVNIDLFNTYEDQDAQNRGVKSDALARGFEGLSDIGSRSNDNRNALQAQLINQQTIRGGYQNYGKDSTTAGTQITGQDNSFNDGTGATLTPYSNYNTNKKANSKSKLGVQFAKGSKSVTVRRYKIKK